MKRTSYRVREIEPVLLIWKKMRRRNSRTGIGDLKREIGKSMFFGWMKGFFSPFGFFAAISEDLDERDRARSRVWWIYRANPWAPLTYTAINFSPAARITTWCSGIRERSIRHVVVQGSLAPLLRLPRACRVLSMCGTPPPSVNHQSRWNWNIFFYHFFYSPFNPA